MYITFEGIDGSGKSTQIENIVEHLNQFRERFNIFTTRGLGWNKEVSGIIRHLVLNGETNPVEKLFLMLADRSSFHEKYVGPILNRNGQGRAGYPPNSCQDIVLCDRGPDSTVAYQGFGENLAPVPFLVEANRISMKGIVPHVTFLLDIDPEVASKRLDKNDCYEKKSLDFFKRVRTGYLEIAKHEQDRVIVIDANLVEDDVFVRITNHIHRILGL